MATRSLLTSATATSRRRLTHPAEYPDLRLRLQASYGLYQDSGLVTAAAADNDPVGAWMHWRRPTLKFLQATAGKRPVLKLAATPAGGNALRFTASANSVLAVTLNATAGVRDMDFRVQEHTAIAAVRFWEAPTATGILFGNNNGSNFYLGAGTTNSLRGSFQNAGSTQRIIGGSTNNAFTPGTGASNWLVVASRLKKTAGDFATGDMEQFLKLSSGVTVPAVSRPAEGSLLNTTSTIWNIGALTSSANPLSMDLAELNIYGAALTDAQIDELIAELKVEHGIT